MTVREPDDPRAMVVACLERYYGVDAEVGAPATRQEHARAETLAHIRKILGAARPLDELQASVLEYQVLYYAPPQPNMSGHEDLVERRGAILDRLFALLRGELLAIGDQWLRSNVGYEVLHSLETVTEAQQALACNAFVRIMDALPRIQVDLEKDLYAYFRSIARHGLFDENGVHLGEQAAAKTSRSHGAPTAAAPSAAMWYPASAGGRPAEDVDPRSVGWEDRVADRLDNTQYLDQIRGAMQCCCSPLEQTILRLRYQDPPLSYKQLADMLGMQEAAVRQKTRRAHRKIRTCLQEQGLL